MRVIIRCAGAASRWAGSEPKHLVKLCGEPVLHRTVRLIGETVEADVKVVVKDLSDRRYLVPGSSRTVDKPTPTNGDLDKIASTRHLWDRDRTVLLWGDTWWSRDALTDVLTAPVDGWHAWIRTVGRGGELFAFAVTDREVVGDALDRALNAHSEGLLGGVGYNGRPARGGWALLRSLCELPWGDHGPYRNVTHLDDWTEDMDTTVDWHRWCHRWATTDPATREAMIR